MLREAMGKVKQKHSFEIDAMVILPEHHTAKITWQILESVISNLSGVRLE